MKKIDTGTTSFTLVPFPFMEHSSNCPMCTYSETQSKGGKFPRMHCNIFGKMLVRRSHALKSLSPSINSFNHHPTQSPWKMCSAPSVESTSVVALQGSNMRVNHRANTSPYCGDEHDLSSAVSVSKVFNKFSCICEKPAQLEHLWPHIKSGCKEYGVDTPQDLTLQHLFNQPLNTQTTSLKRGQQGTWYESCYCNQRAGP